VYPALPGELGTTSSETGRCVFVGVATQIEVQAPEKYQFSSRVVTRSINTHVEAGGSTELSPRISDPHSSARFIIGRHKLKVVKLQISLAFYQWACGDW